MQQEYDFLITNIKKELAKIRKQMDLAKQQEKSAEVTKLEKKQKELINEKQRLWQSRNFDKVCDQTSLASASAEALARAFGPRAGDAIASRVSCLLSLVPPSYILCLLFRAIHGVLSGRYPFVDRGKGFRPPGPAIPCGVRREAIGVCA